ncbi:hypothetical protein F0562_020007 [Nyssa sinensis]|uniref:PHD-type domain-containing protein n=1 Tax=Nyssa sinensis TaxID=561372 RepID=A0A5J5BPY9_9ASTE|nr:hypothetical protein F0562_020007 [Nyssa sinensis]
MGRGGKLGNKQGIKRTVRSQHKDSDESDDDYMVGEDEECEESDEYCSSFAGDDSDESLGELEEEEEEKVRKVGRSKEKKVYPGRKKNWVKKPCKVNRVSYEEDDDEDYDEDEEFMPDENDCIDDEDELTEMKKKKKKAGRPPRREKGVVKGLKRKRNSKVIKKPKRKKRRKNSGLGRKSTINNDSEFTGKNPVVNQRNGKSSYRRRRLRALSDSDFVCSGSSDFEFTISEEEREQVREANELCRSLTISLRSSSSSKILQEEGVFVQKRKRLVRKGKEKVEDSKNVGKQVCGICFSEEAKMTVRGTLNCCSHYFCFACIMEWSKVESRCPLCKQRFATISKPARSNTGFDLRTVVIQVPERDQVYQPSEEELRGYLDPYESVICTECQQGGDDALMLLCDLCDSPAHTYCVGLGREVPEGNWYCEGCRPTTLGSSTPQAPTPTHQRTSNNLTGGSSPVDSVGEGLDLNLMYVPDTPLTQGTGAFSSRRPVRDFQASSPVSGVGAFTVSDRRRIHRQINHLLNNRMSQLGGRANEIPATHLENNIFGSQMDQGREIAYRHTITSERVAPRDTFFEGRLQDNPTHLGQNMDPFLARLSHLRGQVIQGPTSTSTDGSVNEMLRSEPPGINTVFNSRSGYEQPRPCSSRTIIGSDTSTSPYIYREVSHLNVAKEQVQSTVRSHLKSLSRDMELGYSTFKDIARSSTHTILAACGIEHRGNEVYPVQPPSICNHIEQIAVGQMSLMKGHCSSCFELFVKDVVCEIMKTRMSPWFRC